MNWNDTTPKVDINYMCHDTGGIVMRFGFYFDMCESNNIQSILKVIILYWLCSVKWMYSCFSIWKNAVLADTLETIAYFINLLVKVWKIPRSTDNFNIYLAGKIFCLLTLDLKFLNNTDTEFISAVGLQSALTVFCCFSPTNDCASWC